MAKRIASFLVLFILAIQISGCSEKPAVNPNVGAYLLNGNDTSARIMIENGEKIQLIGDNALTSFFIAAICSPHNDHLQDQMIDNRMTEEFQAIIGEPLSYTMMDVFLAKSVYSSDVLSAGGSVIELNITVDWGLNAFYEPETQTIMFLNQKFVLAE